MSEGLSPAWSHSPAVSVGNPEVTENVSKCVRDSGLHEGRLMQNGTKTPGRERGGQGR